MVTKAEDLKVKLSDALYKCEVKMHTAMSRGADVNIVKEYDKKITEKFEELDKLVNLIVRMQAVEDRLSAVSLKGCKSKARKTPRRR